MRKRTEKQNHEILARWLIESREQRGAEAEQSAKTLTLKSPFIKEEGLIIEMTILSSEL